MRDKRRRQLKGLRPERAKAVVDAIADMMRVADPTPFAVEGPSRHGIRAGLLLSGRWTWRDADATARSMVEAALTQIGAKRPTWLQGQPEYVDPLSDNCLRCRRPLPELGRRRRFCSNLCAYAHKVARTREALGEAYNVERRTRYHALKASAPVERCAVCRCEVQRSPMSQAVKAGRRPVCGPKCRAIVARGGREWGMKG